MEPSYPFATLSRTDPPRRGRLVEPFASLRRWFDSEASDDISPHGERPAGSERRIDWLRALPFFGIHAACLGVIWVGWSPVAILVALGLYLVRMFAITGFYHRYFAHRTFDTSRSAQFLFALLGASAAQRGPLWWASHHRHHHAHADQPGDAHSPTRHGFWWSHTGWFLTREAFAYKRQRIADWLAFRELRWLDRFDILPPLGLACSTFALGGLLEVGAPSLGTDGPQMLVWGFFISTVALYHATYLVNSLGHTVGRRRYATGDTSRNNALVAVFTLGEGWHNNHHHFPRSARQGFYWWELDITYYLLRLLAATGVIWNLRTVPTAVRDARAPVRDIQEGSARPS
ncbi:MAG: acyl-CoA desaturase [Gammaproteobacteria bacterium]